MIIFNIDEEARFSDGSPITAHDIRFSHHVLKTSGRPNHRQYYKQAEKVTLLHSHAIRFDFHNKSGPEIPLIFALMPVLSEDYFQRIDFNEASLNIPVGSGPYKIQNVIPGKTIEYVKDPDFWAQDRAPFKGRYNFNQIKFEYFRDLDIAFEALKAGEIDIYFENDPGKWAKRQNVTQHNLMTKEIDVKLPPPFLGIVMNTRRDEFSNRLVRKALTLAYDFEWVNKNLLHSLYKRTTSYFGAGRLKATGLPDADERLILKNSGLDYPESLFVAEFSLPVSTGTGRIRDRLIEARNLLEQAGFSYKQGKLYPKGLNTPFKIELITNDSSHLRLLSNFQKNLQQLGITLTIRTLDSASYQNRIGVFDFDMMIAKWGQSLSPGNEQLFYWHSSSATSPGSRNYPGIRNKTIDYITELIAKSQTRPQLEAAVRILDRLLLWGYYAIPLHHKDRQWLYHTAQIEFPANAPNYGTSVDLWWRKLLTQRDRTGKTDRSLLSVGKENARFTLTCQKTEF